MRRVSIVFSATTGCAFALNLFAACGGHQASGGFETSSSSSSSSSGGGSSSGSSAPEDSGGAPNNNNNNGNPIGSFGDGSVAPPPMQLPSDSGIPCPPGLMCNVSCGTSGMSTSITGKVYDPAGKNPLYNVAVFVPATNLLPLPRGVPTGADACSCPALFKAGALTATATAVDGSFTLTNVPVGDVTLVLQVGKWRRAVKLTTKMCDMNPQPDKSLKLPGTMVGAGPDDNMPDIAVSTGGADTLECLMTRIGVPGSEYVAGNATNGHVHIFSGGNPAGGMRGNNAGNPEMNQMMGSPASSTALWSTQDQLMPYDITLLSCEGGETYNANPAALEAYLNAGGRAFGSHFHYSFFSGPIDSTGTNTYTAPADWGPNLSSWTGDQGNNNGPIGGIIDTTLNGSMMPFPKGLALSQWLKNVNALGTDGVPANDLAIYQPRYNSVVTPTNVPSQPWITQDPITGTGGRPPRGGGDASAPGAPHTMYFSFDAPVGAKNVCGRAVFSDLHVSGHPSIQDTGNGIGAGTSGGTGQPGGMPPPAGCDAMKDLSPQEKALEFMLFDLSSCVISDTIAPMPITPAPPK